MHTQSLTRKPSGPRRIPRFVLLALALLMAGLPHWLAPASAHAATHAPVAYTAGLALQTPTSVTPGPSAIAEGRVRYFSQTAHFLRGAFLSYWETHGATPILGLPITELFVEIVLKFHFL
jgi:hypothetical protein